MKSVIIPERSIGVGFWSQCKALERECYLGDSTIEAARFIERKAFWSVGGFDVAITGPEDWDLPQKVREKYNVVGRITSFIVHNEGNVSFVGLAKKKYYYGKKLAPYLAKHPIETTGQQVVYLLRPAFYRNWKKLVAHPIVTCGMIAMLMAEQVAGFLGYLTRVKRHQGFPRVRCS